MSDKQVNQKSKPGLDFVDLNEGGLPINAVIYGQPGSGKTFLAATSPKPLIIDLEMGAPATVKAVDNDVKVFSAPTLAKVREAYAYLASGDHDFESVVIDPVGELQRIIMKDVIENYKVRRTYDDLPGMADWGKMLNDITKLITAFRALPLNTIVTAHAEVPDNDFDPVKPLVSGKNFAPFLQGAMDLLGYISVSIGEDGKPSRQLLTSSTEQVVAKNRGGKLPHIIREPNMTDIIQRMRAKE